MAAPSRKSAEAKAAARGRTSPVRLANAQDQAARSPALHQQEILRDQWRASEQHAAEPAKWSQRRTVAFVTLSCGGFWALVILGAAQLAR